MSTEPNTVGDDFSRQQERARRILSIYEGIGPAGAFGAAHIRQTITEAERAMAGGDIIQILQSYEALKEIKE